MFNLEEVAECTATLLSSVRRHGAQPLWGWNSWLRASQGSRVRQPWAVLRNPVGIGPAVDRGVSAEEDRPRQSNPTASRLSASIPRHKIKAHAVFGDHYFAAKDFSGAT